MPGEIGKKERAFRFLSERSALFACPLCGEAIRLAEPFFRCARGHNFSVSRKGTTTLLGGGQLRKSAIYNRGLFENRRRFIAGGYYRAAYDTIAALVEQHRKLGHPIRVILDLGCGEGSHALAIRERVAADAALIGLDLAKDAVELARDYTDSGTFFFVGDVTNIPLGDRCVDLALDFLSPYQARETRRALADGGLFVKIVPGERYLEQLRGLLGLCAYPGYEEQRLLGGPDFTLLSRTRVTDTCELDSAAQRAAFLMTPLTNSLPFGSLPSAALPKSATIDLEVLAFSK
ncbi:MAG TPA: methyltransferase domain-containing protein [Clostridia bacterium]|nr:methyltransferase domain-containing protein [Clostridia bacterium]